MRKKLNEKFFRQDVLEVAPQLIGQTLARRFEDGCIRRYRITEVEAYRGEEDLACHAAKGKTARTTVLYGPGGKLYVYLIYGMYWLLNIVTGEEGHPQAVLIRGVEGINGPGRLGRELELDSSFRGESVQKGRIWLEDTGESFPHQTGPRIGIDYAGTWKHKPWRYYVEPAPPPERRK